MKKLLLLAALALGFAFSGLGAGSEAQAKPHGWHGGTDITACTGTAPASLWLEPRPSLRLVQTPPAPPLLWLSPLSPLALNPAFRLNGIDSKPAFRHMPLRRAAPHGAAWLFRTRDPLFFGSWICHPAREQEGAVLNSRT